MVTKFGVGQDAASQAFFDQNDSDEPASIPGEVDSESVVHLVDAGTDIPSRVDNPSVKWKVD